MEIIEKNITAIRLTVNPVDGRVTLKLPETQPLNAIALETLKDFSKFIARHVTKHSSVTMRGKIKGNSYQQLSVHMKNNARSTQMHFTVNHGDMKMVRNDWEKPDACNS